MGQVSVTKVFSLCYGHFLPDYEGKCINQHGHNSAVEVEFIDPGVKGYPGMVIDFSIIKRVVGEILEILDHRNLNDLAFSFADHPTAENIVQWIAAQIQETEIGPGLIRVRMSETPTSWTEWRK